MPASNIFHNCYRVSRKMTAATAMLAFLCVSVSAESLLSTIIEVVMEKIADEIHIGHGHHGKSHTNNKNKQVESEPMTASQEEMNEWAGKVVDEIKKEQHEKLQYKPTIPRLRFIPPGLSKSQAWRQKFDAFKSSDPEPPYDWHYDKFCSTYTLYISDVNLAKSTDVSKFMKLAQSYKKKNAEGKATLEILPDQSLARKDYFKVKMEVLDHLVKIKIPFASENEIYNVFFYQSDLDEQFHSTYSKRRSVLGDHENPIPPNFSLIVMPEKQMNYFLNTQLQGKNERLDRQDIAIDYHLAEVDDDDE